MMNVSKNNEVYVVPHSTMRVPGVHLINHELGFCIMGIRIRSWGFMGRFSGENGMVETVKKRGEERVGRRWSVG